MRGNRKSAVGAGRRSVNASVTASPRADSHTSVLPSGMAAKPGLPRPPCLRSDMLHGLTYAEPEQCESVDQVDAAALFLAALLRRYLRRGRGELLQMKHRFGSPSGAMTPAPAPASLQRGARQHLLQQCGFAPTMLSARCRPEAPVPRRLGISMCGAARRSLRGRTSFPVGFQAASSVVACRDSVSDSCQALCELPWDALQAMHVAGRYSPAIV